MIIQNILSYDRTEPMRLRQLKRIKDEAVTSHAVATDSFVAGGKDQNSAQRDELLAAVRKKLQKGFYNSEAVLEDLSDSFAAVFNKML